jgi:hypothetical protein
MKESITLSQACDGLLRYKNAIGMSPNTIRNYRTTFGKLQAFFSGDLAFSSRKRAASSRHESIRSNLVDRGCAI